MSLQIQNLTLKYPGSPNFVFQDLSFELKEPGFNSLFGPSGVGKTSLAKILTGDRRHFYGKVGHEGMKTFLYSYNTERLPGWSGVGKHLEKITPAGRQERREELISIFGLEDCLQQRFSQLSLGQQNRVNLLRYLLQDFDLLIMDESLANVDELTREKIILRIKTLYPQHHFLYISHNVVEVSKFCHEIVVLRGAERHPQSIVVRGQDARIDREIDRDSLDQTMLEIVNASS
ncbi:MAG: ATP-binding cassette domain-containing protein [Desulfobacterales bacterium]|jgi:ABC-type multidrug transport system ATPase subunit